MLRSLGLALAALMTLVGCPGGGGGSQATPKETVQTMNSALMTGNRNSFLACFKAEGNQKEALSSAFEMSQQMKKLMGAIEKSYGPDGWKKFQGPVGGQGNMGFEGLDSAKLAQLKVELKGDRATATIPGEGQPIELVKDGGKWLIDAKGMGDEMPNPEQGKKMVDAMKKSIDQVIAQVGKPGQSPESLAKLMQTEMMQSMMGASADFMKDKK